MGVLGFPRLVRAPLRNNRGQLLPEHRARAPASTRVSGAPARASSIPHHVLVRSERPGDIRGVSQGRRYQLDGDYVQRSVQLDTS